MKKSLSIVLALVFSFSLVGCKKSPAAPATRIITLSGDMSFGDVRMNTTAFRVLTVANTGTDTLTVNNLTTSILTGVFTADRLSGTVPPGGTLQITIAFTPNEIRAYSGAIIVNANNTEGFPSIPVTGNGIP